eukprot:800301-Pelagomonas_calceolata.AAC.1
MLWLCSAKDDKNHIQPLHLTAYSAQRIRPYLLQVQTEVSGEELRAAEPDMLRNDLDELIKTWNE